MARPRGFIEHWHPKESVANLIDDVNHIIETSDILPLTLRQIFYMLVSNNGYDKTELAYKRLCETMNKARRARLVDMDCIRDDGLTRRESSGYSSRNSFLYTVLHSAKNFTLDRQQEQDTKLYVWCEAGGMVPQLVTAVREYHVPVLSSGGFDSLTTKHDFAKEIADQGKPVVILHLGDHDPSGVHMYGSLDEDLQAFIDYYGGDVSLERIAVTPEQVAEFNLPTAPPKTTDRRSFTGLTTQCEAIHPKNLREIVVSAVEQYIDFNIHEDTLDEEKEISDELSLKFKHLLED